MSPLSHLFTITYHFSQNIFVLVSDGYCIDSDGKPLLRRAVSSLSHPNFPESGDKVYIKTLPVALLKMSLLNKLSGNLYEQ